jgi:hypothetical protein
MQDLAGNEITLGVLLAYPGRKRSKLWLSLIRVHSITPTTITGMNQFGRQVTIRNFEQLVVVHEPR